MTTTVPTTSKTQPRDRRRTLALFLAFLGFYLLTTSGHFYASDEETFYIVTESLGEHGTFAVPGGLWGVATHVNADGREYAVTGPVPSILALPLFLIGKALRPLFPPDAAGYVTRFWVAMFGSFVTAATVALLYRLARRLGYRAGASLGLAALYGLASTAWPHGRTFFAEPLVGLCLLLVFYGFRRGTETADEVEDVADDAPRRVLTPTAWLVIAGLAAIATVATKPQGAIALPPLGLYFLWRLLAPGWRDGRYRLDWRRVLRAALPWGAGLVLGAIPFALYNSALHGGPLRTGYSGLPMSIFSTPLLDGIYGLLLSSGKGLLWYSPPVILALVAWWPFFRRHRAEALACVGVIATHLALYGRFYAWHGDGSWGPRYLTSALPFALLPLPAILAGLRARRWALAAVSLVAALGVAVQLLGVLVNFDWYILASDEQARHFTPAASPLVGHARILGARLVEWRDRLVEPPDSATLVKGFSYGEGDRQAGAVFPRWTTGDGMFTIHPASQEPVLVKLTYFDHRPVALRTDRATVLVNGAPLPDAAVERRDFSGTGEGWIYQFTVPADAFAQGDAAVTLRSGVWNPAALGVGDRDENLGVFLNSIEAWREGVPLATRAELDFEPVPRTTRWRFWWFNNDRDPASPRPHLVDHWAWYAAMAGFDRELATGWIAAVAAVCAIPLIAGGWLLARALPSSGLRPARRKQTRRRAGHARGGRPAGSTRRV